MRAPLLRALAPLLPGLGLGSGGAAGAACLIAARSKTTTGIVGLPVVPDARGELQRAYQAVLDALDAAIPADAEYRRSVEKTVRWKLAAAAGDAPDEQLEELYSRQLEEEIKLCREELALIPKMAEWKPWDVPDGYTVEMLEAQAVEAKVAGGAASPATPAAPPPPPPK